MYEVAVECLFNNVIGIAYFLSRESRSETPPKMKLRFRAINHTPM
jgi:hypothetical protein